MITIGELRRLLGDPELSEPQLEEVRDALHGFARLFIDEYLRDVRESGAINSV